MFNDYNDPKIKKKRLPGFISGFESLCWRTLFPDSFLLLFKPLALSSDATIVKRATCHTPIHTVTTPPHNGTQ